MNYNAKSEKASIIIATLGKRLVELESCLSSALAQTHQNFEVILINDGPLESVSKIVHSIKNLRHRLKLINNSKPMGAAAARNMALQVANGKYAVFIDDDAVAREDWLEKLVKAYDSPDTGGVGGTTIEIASGRMKQKSKFTLAVDTAYEKIEKPAETQFLCGTNMSFKMNILKGLGGFDARLGRFSFFEDTDLSLSVRERGYKLICEPAAVVTHYDIPTGGCTPNPTKRWYWFARNRLYVVLKHPKFFHSIITIEAFSINCFFKFFRRLNASRFSLRMLFLGPLYIIKGLAEAVILRLVNSLFSE